MRGTGKYPKIVGFWKVFFVQTIQIAASFYYPPIISFLNAMQEAQPLPCPSSARPFINAHDQYNHNADEHLLPKR